MCIRDRPESGHWDGLTGVKVPNTYRHYQYLRETPVTQYLNYTSTSETPAPQTPAPQRDQHRGVRQAQMTGYGRVPSQYAMPRMLNTPQYLAVRHAWGISLLVLYCMVTTQVLVKLYMWETSTRIRTAVPSCR